MIPHIHLVPDPSPTPDQQVADRLDGLLSPSTPLARYADIIARLPPEIADVLAAEYTRACRLSPAAAQRYRPSVAALARACGLPRQTFAYMVRRAAAAAAEAARGDIRNAAPGVRMVDGSRAGCRRQKRTGEKPLRVLCRARQGANRRIALEAGALEAGARETGGSTSN